MNGDGGALQDYLHIDDAADAFVAALDHGPEPGYVRRYNIGSGVGSTIIDAIAVAGRVTGRSLPLIHNPPADELPVLVVDPTRVTVELQRKPRRSDLETIIADAWTARG